MNRITIGVFSDWAESAYQKTLLAGIIESAKAKDVNTITYLGGAINAPYQWENERNIIYHYINRDIINGLIIFAGSIGRYCEAKVVESFCSRYLPLPIINISWNFPHIHSISIENFTATQELIKHLAEKHGFRKIAFICGPELNPEAQERFQAYRATLEEMGIPYNPALVIPGSFIYESGITAVHELLDVRKIEVEAIAAANDDMAMGVLDALQKRGIRVPEDIALAGFDDQEKSQYLNPALTTVAQPLYRQGSLAMEILLQLIAGNTLPMETKLQSKLVVRQSCGCPYWEEANINRDNEQEAAASIHNYKASDPWQWIKDHFTLNLTEYSKNVGKKLESVQVKNLFNSFYISIVSREKAPFLKCLDGLLRNTTAESNPDFFLSRTLAILNNLVTIKIGKTDELLFSKEVCYSGQAMINRHLVEISKAFLVKIEQVHQIIHYTSGEALTITSQQAIQKLLYEKLPRLGITNFFFSFYEKLDQKEPEKSISRFFLAYADNKALELPTNGILFSSYKLFPQDLLYFRKRYSFIIEPLFFGHLHFGVAILEAEIQLNSILNTMFRWFLNSVIIVELFMLHNQKEHTSIETEMQARTGELQSVNKKLSETISTLKATQSTLLQQAKMASLGRLTSGIAHELKNPLNFITNFSRLSIEDTEELVEILEKYREAIPGNDRQRITEILADIRDNSEEVYKHGLYADKIIKDMLKQARGESSTIETCQVNVLLKELAALTTRSHRCTEPGFRFEIIEDFDKDLPPIRANVTDLNKVFINFFDNAIYALQKLSVKSPDYKPVLKLVTRQSGNEIIIRFIDNGEGIKEEVMEHIYDPFFTTKPTGEGTGIGLTTSYEIIVERMAGELSCESEEDKGTIFTIKLKI